MDGENDSKNKFGELLSSKIAVPVSILIAGLLISGALVWNKIGNSSPRQGGLATIGNSQGNSTKFATVDIEIQPSDHILGARNAKVTIVEFSDFQCPFCRKFWQETLPEIKKEYIGSGKVNFVYRHFPLNFHPAAQPAAEASECAADQDRFWEMHDKIFEEQAKSGPGTIQFTQENIKNWASQIGLAAREFDRCLTEGKHRQRVLDDLAFGTKLSVSGTPTTFINGKQIVGAVPYTNFKALIEEALKQ